MTKLTPMDITTIVNQMRNSFDINSFALEDNRLYYESLRRPDAIGLATPPEMNALDCRIGWPRLYLDALEERLDIEGFRLAGNSLGGVAEDDRLWSWWQYNEMDEWSGLGNLETLLHGRSYVTVAAPDPKNKMWDQSVPVIKVESAMTMWADTDPSTREVRRAIRVFRDDQGFIDPDRLTLYLPNETIGLRRSSSLTLGEWEVEWDVQHNLGIVPVVPMYNRSRITQEHGQSEITPELRSATDGASRVMMNLQATAELMAIPQRLLIGLSKEELLGTGSDAASSFQAYIARILAIPNKEVTAHQFQAAELRNFETAMNMFSKEAAKATGLPAQYFVMSSDNPASADAIRAIETRLVKKAERKQRMLGGAWERVMRLALLVMDRELPPDAHRLETVWRSAATPTFAAKADAIVKLVSAQTASGVQLLPNEQARIELGYSDEQRRQMKLEDDATPSSQLNRVLNPPVFSDNVAKE